MTCVTISKLGRIFSVKLEASGFFAIVFRDSSARVLTIEKRRKGRQEALRTSEQIEVAVLADRHGN
ncbi:hypothetical protein CO662_23105 [Rhizobium anhuiense]|uniref:Uncharacterized protein n=1 Tax=Rhizobium anhuiense TaxID=1184720 RepID=A0ABX4J4D1_9HYPH|nr:hypothetical protein CO668_30225 [Rhizobium anhuiense]PDS49672.1 hypothetical protein CO662_23105 [Rhizobium anhuiense]